MGSSIFADESGGESAGEQCTDDRRRSVFRRRDDEGTPPGSEGARDASRRGQDASDGREAAADGCEDGGDDEHPSSEGGDGSEDETMTVFSGDEVYEFAVDDG